MAPDRLFFVVVLILLSIVVFIGYSALVAQSSSLGHSAVALRGSAILGIILRSLVCIIAALVLHIPIGLCNLQ